MIKFTVKLVCLLLTAVAFLLNANCKKKDVLLNRSPIAMAGPDQRIALPVDSVLLDGTGSSDPDGTINSWLWTKISGPASSKIANDSAAKTLVTKLSAGAYRFELKITDNGNQATRDTIIIMVDSGSTVNQAPVVNAGGDREVLLPVDTIILDGSGTFDPNNDIVRYEWVTISGPSACSILTPDQEKTLVTGLQYGVYTFGLRVTDATGLSSFDMATVTVSSIGNCNDIPVSIVNGNGTLNQFGNLSLARYIESPATAADKIVFGGGVSNGEASDRVDIYNMTTKNWSTATLHDPNWGTNVVVGNKILFFSRNDNTDKMDVYDALADGWSQVYMDPMIMQRGPSIVVAGNKVFFAGGFRSQNNPSSRVDIYDVGLNSWSLTNLSEARSGINAITVRDKVIFAGGFGYWDFDSDYPENLSRSVDIYNTSTNSWSTTVLPAEGVYGNAVTLGDKAFFTFENIGGFVSIYNVATNSWSTATLSSPRHYAKTITVGGKVLIAGGVWGGNGSNKVDIYDALTGVWSTANLSHPGIVGWNAAAGNKLLLNTAGLNSSMDGLQPKFDIFDASSNSWSVAELSHHLFTQPVVAGGDVYLGGGIVRLIGGHTSSLTCQVWKFRF